MAEVELDYSAWVLQFPAFNTLTPEVVQSYWDLAGLYIANCGCGGIANPPRAALLNLMTAHLAQIFSGSGGSGPSGLVGRIDAATEGSVSVHTASMGEVSPSAAWYQQTPYGAALWQALGPYRTARYIPGPVRSFEPWGFVGPYGIGPGAWRGPWGS